ncbi:MAG: hypothetical protein VB948_14790, partial [Pseudomonadales bacterium]
FDRAGPYLCLQERPIEYPEGTFIKMLWITPMTVLQSWRQVARPFMASFTQNVPSGTAIATRFFYFDGRRVRSREIVGVHLDRWQCVR